MSENLLTPREAAARLGCSTATVYRWILSGKLPAVTRGGTRYLVRPADVLALLTPVRPARVVRPARKRGQKLRERRAREVLRAAGLE